MNSGYSQKSNLQTQLLTNRWAQICEIVSVFAAAAIIIFIGLQLAGESLFAKQLVIVAANIVMLLMVWFGLRLRDQNFEHFGISFNWDGWRPFFFVFLKSLVAFVIAVGAFIFGAIVMANIVGIPEQADLTGYNYLSGNLPLLLVSLVSVFVISSFGEEIIYRGFLMNRITEIGGGSKAALRSSVVISAVIFGLAHFAWGIVGIVETAFMGLALSLLYIVFKRNLWVLVLAHGYMDALLLIPLYFK